MRRISAYFISLLFLSLSQFLSAQDTVMFPLKIRAGFDIAGPGIYLSDKNNRDLEGYISFDRSEKMAYVLEGGTLTYKFSQYNYTYNTKGIFFRIGPDFNLLKPGISKGKYWAGIGFRYGISFFTAETPFFSHENYWDKVQSSIPSKSSIGHFIEVDPGIRTEVFRNFSMGWTIRLRMLISGGGGNDLKPIYFPGFGAGGKTVNAGINYYLTWSIPFKTKRVITKPEPVEVPDESEQPVTNQNQRTSNF